MNFWVTESDGGNRIDAHHDESRIYGIFFNDVLAINDQQTAIAPLPTHSDEFATPEHPSVHADEAL